MQRFEIIRNDQNQQCVRWHGNLDVELPTQDAERVAMSLERDWNEPSTARQVVIELVACEEATTTGLAMLVLLNRQLKRSEVSWRITHAPISLMRILSLMSLEQIFPAEQAEIRATDLVLVDDLESTPGKVVDVTAASELADSTEQEQSGDEFTSSEASEERDESYEVMP